MEMIDPVASSVPPSSSALSTSAFSSSTTGVTLEAIMEQLQWMQADFGGHLNYLINEMCQMNTWVSRIARLQVRMASLAPSPSPSPEALPDDEVDDDEDDVDSSSDDEMTTS